MVYPVGPASTSPEHFMVELRKPCLVPPGLAEQEQASPECFLEWNHVALLGIFGWCVLFWEWCVLFGRKSALTDCSPWASCYLEQKVGGSWILCRLKNCCLEVVLLVTCAFLKEKVHSLSVAPEPLAIWNKKLEGLESELFERTENFSCCNLRAYIRVVLFRKNSDAWSWHILVVCYCQM